MSDRGEDDTPRYAFIDGQHRWAAAQLLTDPPLLVANVHEGLNIGQEAALFDKLNRQRKQPTPWDHWRARKAAGDRQVLAIDACVRRHGLEVAEGVRDGHIVCISTLEKIGAAPSGIDLLVSSEIHQTTSDLDEAWQSSVLAEPSIAGSGGHDGLRPPPEYKHPNKHWRAKRSALPQWYKQRNGIRAKAQSGAARVARFRPPRNPAA